MKKFMDRDFLLESETAQVLFHTYAQGQPIFDFHNHLSPGDVAMHRRFHDLTELWLEADHYKWRAMRACGVDESLITGGADPYDKFLAWAGVLPKIVGSPLYHWAHPELQRYFGIFESLCPANAADVWEGTKNMMEGEGFDAVRLLDKMRVEVLCTTDDPIDDLGRVAIPKEIRRTMRIREGTPSQTILSPWERFCLTLMEIGQRTGLEGT